MVNLMKKNFYFLTESPFELEDLKEVFEFDNLKVQIQISADHQSECCSKNNIESSQHVKSE